MGLPHREDQPADLPDRRRLRLPPRRAHRGEGVRRPQVHRQPRLRGHVQGGARRRGETPPEVRYDPQLIDATYALLLATTGEALVIPALNRDGDTLSDLVMQMFGTIAGAESTLLAFDDTGAVTVVMTEAPHGTAPALQGKNVANPMAMILAVASLLGYMKGETPRRASRSIYEAALEAVSDGIRTADLGGHASTSDFTAEVIRRVKTKVEVWSALADVER